MLIASWTFQRLIVVLVVVSADGQGEEPKLTAQSTRYDQCRPIHPGIQCERGHMVWTAWSKRACHIAGWRSGGCPTQHRINNQSTTLSNSLSLSSSTKDSMDWQSTYGKVTAAMIIPACRGVNYSCGVDTADYIYEGHLGIRRARELSPSFVIDDLVICMLACMTNTLNCREKTNPSHN